MDCRNFEEIVSDLAGDRIVNAVVRKSALAHTSVCEHCARRLAAERALTARLLEFAEATADEHASPRVRRQLRAAVAELKIAQVNPVKAAPVISIASLKRPTWKQWAWGALATAAILALFAIAAVLLNRPVKPAPEELMGETGPAPARTQAPQQSALFMPTAERDQEATQLPKTNVQRRAPRRSRSIDRTADENEIASEFIPLTLAADEKELENGMLVRLEVPRARLIAMGVPLHIEGNQEIVNAEVMMGDNGVAYAIRVVR
jgi:hypothetical protein